MTPGRILKFCALFAVLLLCGPRQAAAQKVPDAINDALADLSTRAGYVITLSDLAGWHWSEQNYLDTSLGCPQPGETYRPVITRGYQFQLNYQGTIYDYRVSANRQILILCSPVAPVTPTPTIIPPSPTALPLPTLTPTPAGDVVCAGAMPSYLRVGVQVQVRATNIPIRSRPSQSGPILDQIPPGGTAWIIAGPQCGEGLVWWAVDHNGVTGWTAEGQNGVYGLETILEPGLLPTLATTPLTSVALNVQSYDLPDTRQVIVPGNTTRLGRMRELTANERLGALAWSPDGSTLAGAGTSSVWLFDTSDFDLAPRLLRVPPTQAIAFSPDLKTMATGHDDNSIRLWDFAIGGQRTILRGHNAPVSAIAFSSNLIASAAGTTILLWDTSGALVAILEGHSGAITDLTFSPDGTLLASASADDTVRLWDMVSATLAMELAHPAPVNAVRFSPDGLRLATAADDGLVRVWQIGAQDAVVLAGYSGPLVALAYSPDGRVLAAADSVNVIRFWDGTTGAELASAPYGGQSLGRAAADLVFSPDGTVLALLMASDDSQSSAIELWGVK